MSTTDLSYFSLRLQELLWASFPELATNRKFIAERAAIASAAYEDAFRAGNALDYCTAVANNVLFEGLQFSRFDMVFQVVCNEFDTIMADEEIRPFAMQMLTVCLPVFSRYELTDEFAYSSDYEMLYTELTGTIQIWIEENGLQ